MSKGKARKPRATRGALTLLAVLLAMSGAIRLYAPAAAIAREVANRDPAAATPLADEGCRTAEDVELALAALAEREQRVADREAEIDERMATLSEAEAAMKETMAELQAAEDALGATLSVASTAAEDDLARLTAVYETMKPKEAAALFAEMDPQFAAGFLGRMRPDAAAAVMAGLDPQTAYTISVVLAARNADVPKE